MRRWGRVAWDGLIMYKEEQLMYLWERLSWFKLWEWKKIGRGKPKITLIVVQNDIN